MTVPSSALVAGATYYVAFFDPNATNLGWQADFAGPASVSGNVLTLALTSGVTFVSRTTYALTVYAISSTSVHNTCTVTEPNDKCHTNREPFTVNVAIAKRIVHQSGSVSIPAPGSTEVVTVQETGYTGTFT